MPVKVKPYSVIRAEAPIPDDLTKGHGLVALYALQQWESFAPNYPEPLAHSYFYKNLESFLHGLENVSRKTALKHIDTRTCLVCDTTVDLSHSVLDHIIARALGGPEALQNSIVLCRRCNSSKGTKDLLEWWQFKGYPVESLPRNVVCLYARMHWQHYGEAVLAQAIPPFMQAFLLQRAAMLPTDQHRIALYGVAYAGCAYVRWLKEPQRNG